MKKKTELIVFVLALACVPLSASALDLVEAYNLARSYDPQFQGAVAERDVNQFSAQQAKSAYLPEASYSRSQIQTVGGAVQSLTISQPVLSLDRYATYRQSEPRAEFASATYQTREQELATRVLKAVTDLIRAREAAVLNEAKITNFERQNARARRLFELGQGTITDLRDIQVKYEQAKANQINLLVAQRAAERAFSAITGALPSEKDFRLPQAHQPVLLEPLETFKSRLEEKNPSVNASRQQELISRLEAQRVKGSMFPTVSFAHTRSIYSGVNNSTTGVTMQVPLNAGNYYSSNAAAANAVRAKEDRRFSEEKARVELDRLYGMVQAGQEAIKIKRNAIDTAELSIEANQKSYDAGVRSNIDVVNSIQVLFEVKNDYVVGVTQAAENLIALLLLIGTPPESATSTVEQYLSNNRGFKG